MSDELKLTVESQADVEKTIQAADAAIEDVQKAAPEVQLTLDPAPEVSAAPTAAAVQEAPAPEVDLGPAPSIQLTLAPDAEQGDAKAVADSAEAIAEKPAVKPEDIKPVFTPAEQKMIDDFSKKIDSSRSPASPIPPSKTFSPRIWAKWAT